MKHCVMLILILALLGAIHTQAEEVLPPRFNFDRYSKMVDHSPFAVATEVAAPAATPDFAKDLYIANAARSPDGDMVTLASSSDHNFKKYLTTKEPVDGYTITSIEWSDKVGATKVTISKDGNFATLTFNQALLSQSGPNAGLASKPLPPPPVPAMPNRMTNVPNPALQNLPPGVPAEVQQLIPSRDAARPHARGVIQRNPGSAPKVPNRVPAAAAAKQ
ncbi:MAG TPA: hypothetical protein VJ420_04380 [Candidatus Udaeobacter sp.]|nr:hypothetical protein [Candidatus Udaeobacter sp.]